MNNILFFLAAAVMPMAPTVDVSALVDYSYAGYHHSVEAPVEDVYSLGYRIINVVDYGAVPDDGKSDRDAFVRAFKAAEVYGGNPDAKAIVYVPEGEFIMHTSDDDVDGKSIPLRLNAGHVILKGAGADRTFIDMHDPNLPSDISKMYSSPWMLHLGSRGGFKKIASVAGDSAKGSFSVILDDAKSVREGEYYCLRLTNNSRELIDQEFSPCHFEESMTDISGRGIMIRDYRKVKSVDGNVVTFEEPLLHAVQAKWGWELCSYNHVPEVGVEDICFRGHAKDDFVHHGSWQDDGAYKPLQLEQVVNGWVRRCRFVDVSEACLLLRCANVSAYRLLFEGKRGHSSIYTAESSRVFMGATRDVTSGAVRNKPGTYRECAGQWHGVGVSRPDMGNVVWRNQWGLDACFQSHASQPLATLVDNCWGGWVAGRQGGALRAHPNHMADLVIWNFESVETYDKLWVWWNRNGFPRYVHPSVIGFHGDPCRFDERECDVISNGEPVEPESLFEYQLVARLGYLPDWLEKLKSEMLEYHSTFIIGG